VGLGLLGVREEARRALVAGQQGARLRERLDRRVVLLGRQGAPAVAHQPLIRLLFLLGLCGVELGVLQTLLRLLEGVGRVPAAVLPALEVVGLLASASSFFFSASARSWSCDCSALACRSPVNTTSVL